MTLEVTMPLDRQHITVASRIMLPAYAVVNLLFGLVFITDPAVEEAPSLAAARRLLPMDAWGGLWIALGATMLVALAIHQRGPFVGALCLNVTAWGAWGLLIEIGGLSRTDVTLLAGVLPAFVAVASSASLASLMRGDRSE